MFTKPQALLIRHRGRVRRLLVPRSCPPCAPAAEGPVGNSTATTGPARTRPVTGRVLTKAAAAVAVAAFVLAVAGPATAVSLADQQNLPEIAAEGPSNSLDYYYQSVPGVWHEEQVPGGGPGTTYSAPSLAQVGGTTVIAVEGPGNSLSDYVETGGTWQEQQIAGSGTTFSAPSVTGDTANGGWRNAAEGLNNSLYFYYPAFIFHGFTIWRAQQVAKPGTTYSAPSLAETYQGLGIAAEGSGNSLDFYVRAPSGAWTPQQVAAGGKAYSAPSLAMVPGGTGIAVEGPANSLMLYLYANGWQPQQVAAGNVAHSAPALVQLTQPDGMFTLLYTAIAVEGPAGFLDVYTKGTSPTWQLTVPGGFNSTWSAPSLAQIDGNTAIAAQGWGNSLDYYYQPTLSVTWTLQQLAGRGTTYG